MQNERKKLEELNLLDDFLFNATEGPGGVAPSVAYSLSGK